MARIVDEQANPKGDPVPIGCECGVRESCDLTCIFGEAHPALEQEVNDRLASMQAKIEGKAPLCPGEFIHEGRVWYSAERL